MRWRIRRSIVKYTRWNGCPCSNPIVGRTGEVSSREARFAAREFENTLEVVEVVGVGNRESIFNFACKCRYEAKIPVPARFLTVDLSHSGFSSMKSLQVLFFVLFSTLFSFPFGAPPILSFSPSSFPVPFAFERELAE